MKPLAIRAFAAAMMALLVWVMLAAATSPPGQVLAPDQLIILSTTDVKGKTSPCG